MDKIEQARKLLEEHNQQHITVNSEELANQILNMDFEQLEELYKEIENKEVNANIENLEPVKAINQAKLSKTEIEEYITLGEEKIKNGKFAIAIMAGGQGTRLGHKGPKGTFEIELGSKMKSLFEVTVDKLKDAQKKYNITLTCYIMTSPENNEDTIKFFEKRNYFDYPKENIKFFKQGELPLLNKEGKLIMSQNGLIKEASDGNGGIFYSMAKNGIISDMKQKGKE